MHDQVWNRERGHGHTSGQHALEQYDSFRKRCRLEHGGSGSEAIPHREALKKETFSRKIARNTTNSTGQLCFTPTAQQQCQDLPHTCLSLGARQAPIPQMLYSPGALPQHCHRHRPMAVCPDTRSQPHTFTPQGPE